MKETKAKVNDEWAAPKNNHWSPGEEMLLLTRWHSGKPLSSIALLHGRPESGLVAKLAKIKRCTAKTIQRLDRLRS